MSTKPSDTLRFSFSGLNSQIFFFVIFPLSLLLLAITFGSVSLHQDAMRNLVGERDQRTVRSAASALREQLNHRASAIRGIAIRADDQITPDEILNSVDYLLPDFDAGIAFFTSEGKLISTTDANQIWGMLEENIILHVVEQSSQIGSEPIFSDPIIHPNLNEYYSLVMFQTNPNKPIVVGVFSVTDLARTTLSGALSFENKGMVVLVDQDKNLLFRSGNLELIEDNPPHPGITGALNGESGTTYYMAKDGEHVVAFSPVSPTNWALVIEEPWHTVASPLLRYSETGSLVLVPIVIFALFALWFGTRKIIQPLNKLQKQAIAFTQGEFGAFEQPIGGIREIQVLHTTFGNMALEVEEAQQTLKKYLGMITDSQEEERRRLARELHDDTIQSLIALNQRVILAKRMTDLKGFQEAMQEIESMISQTMDELRRLTKALRPIYLEDLGLVTALNTLTQEMSQTSSMKIKFLSEGEEQRLTDNIEIALFRISQEALSNILRHSKATEAAVRIDFRQTEVLLEITDNGKGFKPPNNPGLLSNLGHFGLLGIYERAELIGASISVDSEISQGTTIRLVIPT